MRKFKLDPKNRPKMTATELAHLDAMTDDEITAAALSDPDNPPLPDAEFAKMASVRRVRGVRARTGLSQARFAETYQITVGRLRDLEQGRTQADSALLAYLAVIDAEPEAVDRALVKWAMAASEPVFAAVWDSAEDAAYDEFFDEPGIDLGVREQPAAQEREGF